MSRIDDRRDRPADQPRPGAAPASGDPGQDRPHRHAERRLGLGTKTAAAEWNILCDPEAAAIVYGSGIPITMVPVDASGTVPITGALIDQISRLKGPAASLAAELLASLVTTYRPGVFVPPAMPLHDPCAILAVAAPEIVKTAPARVDVETAPGLNYGRTVVDFAGRTDNPNNCDVVIAFDVEATHAALVDAIRHLSELQTGS